MLFDPSPVTNCHTFSNPLSPSSVTYFMDGPQLFETDLRQFAHPPVLPFNPTAPRLGFSPPLYILTEIFKLFYLDSATTRPPSSSIASIAIYAVSSALFITSS